MIIDCGSEKGTIKELHGVNCAPYKKNYEKNQRLIKKVFEYCNVPRSRLHDCCGGYGGCYYVDVPNIFRNFDADETKEENYDFYYTDEYIGAIISTGAQIVYRLGVTIEWGSKKYTCHPPKDFFKWARICEHIILHYNQGWANGFQYGIEYWEIWNEPENPPMWTGSKEQFFNLYEIASKHLKTRFPDLKIGGYGSCGFYAAFRENMSDFYKGFLTFFTDFLQMCKDKHCPLDFYTWHIYTPKVEEIIKSANHVRKTLDMYGFNKTESHLNEWNYGAEGGGFDNMATLKGAGFIAAALISMQKNTSVDLAQYYCLSAGAIYNGFLDCRTDAYTPVIHVYHVFGEIFKAGKEVEVISSEEEPYTLAAKDKEGKLIALISNYGYKGRTVSVTVKGKGPYTIYLLTNKGFKEIAKGTGENLLKLKKDAVYYIKEN